jgi:hypothetical protein
MTNMRPATTNKCGDARKFPPTLTFHRGSYDALRLLIDGNFRNHPKPGFQ